MVRLIIQLAFVLTMLHPAIAGTPFQVERGVRQLFLDDVGIEKIEQLSRTMHPPSKKGAVIRPNWHLGVHAVQIPVSYTHLTLPTPPYV